MNYRTELLEQLDLNESIITELTALENYVRQLEWRLGITGQHECEECLRQAGTPRGSRVQHDD
jgi:hypothetical protein